MGPRVFPLPVHPNAGDHQQIIFKLCILLSNNIIRYFPFLCPPTQVTISNMPEGHFEEVEAKTFPGRDNSESYKVPLTRTVYIESTDFRTKVTHGGGGRAQGAGRENCGGRVSRAWGRRGGGVTWVNAQAWRCVRACHVPSVASTPHWVHPAAIGWGRGMGRGAQSCYTRTLTATA